jgi:hypothetical protein
MVVRIWRGWTLPANAAAYAHHLRAETFPALRGLEGHLSAEILSREVGVEVEFVVCTRWRSRGDIAAFAGEDVEVAVVPPEAVRLLSRFEPTVAHFDVVP